MGQGMSGHSLPEWFTIDTEDFPLVGTSREIDALVEIDPVFLTRKGEICIRAAVLNRVIPTRIQDLNRCPNRQAPKGRQEGRAHGQRD
jgi:hypothetical protein